jgi:hypothetical protein
MGRSEVDAFASSIVRDAASISRPVCADGLWRFVVGIEPEEVNPSVKAHGKGRLRGGVLLDQPAP